MVLGVAARRVAALAPVALLALATACASALEDRRSVLIVDACAAAPVPEPLDLKAAARAAGCATAGMGPWFAVDVRVLSVVSPREWIVSSRYGVERVSPWLEAATLDELQRVEADRSAELCRRLEASLLLLPLVEPNRLGGPGISDEGLRIVSLFVLDAEPIDELVRDACEGLAAGDGGVVELSTVHRNDHTLAARLASAVTAAEQHSDFVAPAQLSARWVTYDRIPPLSWEVGACIDEEPEHVDPTWRAWSPPGGLIDVREDHDWREAELRFILAHELVHQHQFALCAAGAHLAGLPAFLWEAHASSSALLVLEASGASEAELRFAREFDPYAAFTRIFDAFRARFDWSPDACLLHLGAHRDDATRWAADALFNWHCRNRGLGLAGDGSLAFAYGGRSANGQALVTITNTEDRPFAGFFNGTWHLTQRDGKRCARGTMGTPFALRLPPKGRLTVVSSRDIAPDADILDVHGLYRPTPAPVFDSLSP